jgi:hypothetical protein
MYGLVEIDGKKFIERVDIIPLEVTPTASLGITTGSIVLPGTANVWLKALGRETLVNGAPAVRRFRFRLGNSDGGIWYMNGGIGGTTERVLDSLVFGNGQFPYVLIPHIFYSASASIKWEIEDVSNSHDYTIFMAFYCTYLLPAG